MPEITPAIKASVGFASETGPRERNEDFAGAVFGMELPKPRRDIIAAIADGIGGAKGGRVAAETAVRGFLDGFCDLPETMEVGRAGATVLNALNSWIFSQGRRDNKLSGMGCTCTALVVDIVALPSADSATVGADIMQLPLIPVPIDGQTVDGFVLKVLISDGRYTRLFGAMDEVEGGEVALKFPKPQVATAATYHAAFVREAWVGARVNSPWIGRIIELPPRRQTCLYTVMPLYQGELLSTRLARRPSVGLEEGRNIAIKLARGVAALHRAGIIHRDIKPDNIILESEGSLKLIDLGVVRVPGLEDFPPEDIPGTMAYMAPEMLAGEPGNEATDVYALGVTMFRTFTGEFPYGNLDAVSQPRRGRATPLAELRPDLPAWLQVALGRAIATDPAERFRDVMEFALEMEAGPSRAPTAPRRPQTLYERSPLRFWQGVAALLALALILSLWWR